MKVLRTFCISALHHFQTVFSLELRRPLEAKQACETMGSVWLGVGLVGWSITLPRNRIGGQKFLKENQVLGKGET